MPSGLYQSPAQGNERAQARCYLTWALQSRLRDSNPRPTHYEDLAGRALTCTNAADMPSDLRKSLSAALADPRRFSSSCVLNPYAWDCSSIADRYSRHPSTHGNEKVRATPRSIETMPSSGGTAYGQRPNVYRPHCRTSRRASPCTRAVGVEVPLHLAAFLPAAIRTANTGILVIPVRLMPTF